MRFITATVALLTSTLVSAAPTLYTRQQSKANLAVLRNILHIFKPWNNLSHIYPLLEFAELLEELETNFYTQALQKLRAQDFVDAGFSVAQIALDNVNGIMGNEAAHAQL